MSKLILWCVVFFVSANYAFSNNIEFIRDTELQRIDDVISSIQRRSNIAGEVANRVQLQLDREKSKFVVRVDQLKQLLNARMNEYHDEPNGVDMALCMIFSYKLADIAKSYIEKMNACIIDNMKNIFLLEYVVNYFAVAIIKVAQIRKDAELCDVDPKNITQLDVAKECYHNATRRADNEFFMFVHDLNLLVTARTITHVRHIRNSCIDVHEYSAVNKKLSKLSLKTANCIETTRKRTFWEDVSASIFYMADTLCTPIAGFFFCFVKSLYAS